MHEYVSSGIPELPERVCVETRFVSRELAKLQNLTYLDLGSGVDPLPPTNTSNLITTTVMPFTASSSMVDAEAMTENPNPVRDRCLQTKTETKTIAIQCDLNQEETNTEFNKFFKEREIVSSEEAKNNDAEDRFQNFIKAETHYYSNGMLECMLCSEIQTNAKYMESHMALHWGPQKLCFRCGLYFEHKILLKKHNCAPKRPTMLQYIKCPHYLCAASVISPLELYDHLNEHCGIPLHRCTACCASFPTTGELRLHFRIHKKCSTDAHKISPDKVYKIPAEDTKYRKRVYICKTKKKKRLLVKKFLSRLALRRKKNFSHYCNVCLHRCRSFSQYQLHMKRCLEIYRRRLRTKRGNAALDLMLLNGINNGH